jgi:ligand-binding sensor domain-containing protein
MVQYLTDMAVDGRGRIYYSGAGGMLDRQGISVFDGQRWQMFLLDERPLSNAYQAITQTPDGNIWVAGRRGVQVFPAGQVAEPWRLINLQNAEAQAFYPASQGLWIGTTWGAAFWDYQTGALTYYQSGAPGEALSSSATAITVDSQNRVWFGTFEGLTVLDGQTYTYYDLLTDQERQQGKVAPLVYAILYDRQGQAIWVGVNGALYRFAEGGGMARYDRIFEEVLPGVIPSIGALALEPDGNLLAGVWNKLVRFDGKNLTPIYETPSVINAMLVDRYGRPWLATENDGVFLGQIDAELGYSWSNMTTAAGLSCSQMGRQSILMDNMGGYWFACNDGGLALYVIMGGGQ